MADGVRSHLRNTDVLGRLQDGRLAALLVHATEAAVELVAKRVERQLRESGPDVMFRVAVGRAPFPAAGDSPASLIAAAEEDMLGRQVDVPRLVGSTGSRA
jgi:GGDEF domain-containing protein